MKNLMVAIAVVMLGSGCSASPTPNDPHDIIRTTKKPGAAGEKIFAGAVAAMKAEDARGWSVKRCEEVAEQFDIASQLFARAKKQAARRSARYNEALVHERCDQQAKAKKILAALAAEDAGFDRARVRLALLGYAESGDTDAAIVELQRVVGDSKYRSVEALVQLAALKMKRNGAAIDEEGNADLESAHLNLQRALAIDDRHMPAHNQLALYYLQAATGRAPESDLRIAADAPKAESAEQAKLELAALVCQQAIAKDASYAPIHNTAGLISAELGDLSAAVRSFDKARKMDAGFFEAHMNFAAVNMQFRGFGPAESAYQAALKLHPKSYDAHLGLALALRGQIGSARDDGKLFARSLDLLAAARKLDDKRPEAYFNQAILVLEFQASDPGKASSALEQARGLFTEFVRRAEGKARYVAAVKEAEARVRDIDEMVSFNKGS